jgi:acetylornithine deacetylase/succinyl-diaminopimelate desuccinylase-like protein
VATRLFAGHADNALPQLARATVNCRIIPGTSADEVEATLKHIVANDEVIFSRDREPTPSDPSPLRADIVDASGMIMQRLHPGVIQMPDMSTGATDGLYTRNAGIPTYGISGMFFGEGDGNAHGQDERINVQYFYDSQDYWLELVKGLTSN